MFCWGSSLELVGCNSDTWKMGWMCDSARDRLSQNACVDLLHNQKWPQEAMIKLL